MRPGAHLILGFEGAWPSDDFLRLVEAEKITGVILFARNLEDKEQIRRVIQCLKEARGGPLLVGVDHEGGRVFRLPKPFTSLPVAREHGNFLKQGGAWKELEDKAYRIAAELYEVGFNINFAPVLDVDTCKHNPIIGDRAFSADPKNVSKAGRAFMSGFHRAGIISCGKHFPGHGDTNEDSHKTLPVVSKAPADLETCELIPFKEAIADKTPCLMTAHVLYPALDEQHCATLSYKILHELLRDKMGYEGLVISDDLLMEGIRSRASVPEAALQALHAGCDTLLICRDLSMQLEAVQQIRTQLASDSRLQAAHERSLGRLQELFNRFDLH